MPLAGDFLSESQVGKEKYYPLRIFICLNCNLVQIIDLIDPSKLFKDYRYTSSIGLKNHFEGYARYIKNKFFHKDSFIVEIGSNDGVLLEPLKNLGFRVLGVDPATNIVQIARSKGLDTINDFFTLDLAKKIKKQYKNADLIIANNVLAHIDDMDSVFKGIEYLLSKEGLLVFEVHYLISLLSKTQYDFFYHEHLNYYSIEVLSKYLKKFDLEIFDVNLVKNHGGSIRVFVKRFNNKKFLKTKRLSKLLLSEKKYFKNNTYLRSFIKKIDKQKSNLIKLLINLKAQNKRIIGYGSSGRANTIINFCGINKEMLDYIIDASPERSGRYTPGSHIYINNPDILKHDKPDYILLFAWTYSKAILDKEKEFLENGGSFIVPLPNIKVIKLK